MAEQKEEKPSFRLSYFPAPGRAGPIRLALAVGGYAFEDVFVTFQEHGKAKAEGKRRWGGLPELTIFDKDGKEVQTIGQSCAQLRYIGRLAGIYGANPFEQALIDEFMDAVTDAGATLGYKGETDKEKQKAMRLALIADDGALTAFLKKFALRMEENEKRGNKNGFIVGDTLSIADLFLFGAMGFRMEENEKRGNKNGFIVGDTLSIADLFLFGAMGSWISGYYDHIPKDLFAKHERLDKHFKMIGSVDKIKAFNDKFMPRCMDFRDEAKDKDAKVPVCVYPGKQADIYGK
eukprot:CAMPEP_0197073110 /NCGR_PEP_ID=MMETSP1384-20130603/210436_1 /TAXON_ID=29189 /ORGANISM="Ammonia sp." /LENGTH=290 /DNA_ID=CAMNT_0042511937 /DNA_START=80 /DNA_END=952 /DNA_ORIENTATION=+